MPTSTEGRRPLKSRDIPFFKSLAETLARVGVPPNVISFASIIFAGAAGLALASTACTHGIAVRLAWLSAAAFIQLRLLANMLDGMVAVEGGRGGPTGELWNEAPDRVADTFIFIGAGYAAGSSPLLGFAAALMAVFVAYVRALGASVGAGQIFVGPMAKPHRMFALTVLSLAGAIFPRHMAAPLAPGAPPTVVVIVLALIILGCAITAIRRLARIAAFLRVKAS
ncbi:MAG: CDP-alcohol phosphatidyltransferase family protein [Chthoniobacteraceae bacterium]